MQPRIIYCNPQEYDTKVYNQVNTFKLENFGLIKSAHLILEITPSVATTYCTPTSPYVVAEATLESEGNVIAKINTSYTLGRLDELKGDMYDQIIGGATLQGVFNATQTISMPLFFSCFDGQSLDTRKYKNLVIRIITAPSYVESGFIINTIASISPKLRLLYNKPKSDELISLKNHYNVFRTISTFPNGTKTMSFKMNVPYKVCNIYFMLRSKLTSVTKKGIESITLSSPMGIIGKYDDISNYYLGEDDSANYSNTFAIQVGDRHNNTGDYFEFNGQFNPVIAEITVSGVAVTDDFNLYICYEYYSDIVEKDNMLFEEIPGSYIKKF